LKVYTAKLTTLGRISSLNYLGVMGTIDGSATTPPSPADGLLFVNSGTELRDVTDGASQTLMMGERGIPRDLYWGFELCGWGSNGTGNGDNILTTGKGIGPGNDDGTHNMHFWSHHGSGCHFVLADGSVRFISYNVDFQTFMKASTRAGGETLGEF
jgi:hypothetical protein